MAPNLDSPVQTQMATAVLSHALSSEFHSCRTDGRPSGRRRVFVQTDRGCVLGIDLERGDNVHTVKRRLQLAFNVPIEESSLTFGDLVLKNDLSVVRNDSPLLLTRNLMHRSSSTPCLSPTGKDIQQKDHSDPIEIIGCSGSCSLTNQLIKDVKKAINSGVDPIPVHGGLGGAYYFKNSQGERVAIIKPTDEEPFAPNNPKGFIGKALGQPGVKRSVRVGETGFREVAAYLLDHDHFANVPPTVLVKVTHPVFNINEVGGSGSKAHGRRQNGISKLASFQQFISHDFDASDHGTSNFPVAAVHRIGILDIRILNTDRHAGNILVRRVNGGVGRLDGQVELIPIDHGLCLPESLEDPYFEWIHWPQASIPFSGDELGYIANLDPVQDSDILRKDLPMIRDACLRVLTLCTIFLREAAIFGLCLAEIGEMMSREYRGMEEAPSELEVVCIEARRMIRGKDLFHLPVETAEDEQFQFEIDCEIDEFMSSKLSPTYQKGGCPKTQLSRLDESVEEDEQDTCKRVDTDISSIHRIGFQQFPATGQLSTSLSGVGLADKRLRYKVGSIRGDKCNAKANYSFGGGGVRGNSRSANEQMPASASFVKLADMSNEEWNLFLEKFLELLPGAFRTRKAMAVGRQRLGTSCQF